MNTDEVLRKGISFLANEQQKNGGFLSLSSSQTNDFNHAKKYHSPFFASLIFSATVILPKTPELGKLHKSTAQFLLSQKSAYWSFNYWERDGKEASTIPYPDDIDCTLCALSALQMYDPSIIDGEVIGMVATMLTATEEKEGGPYRTWLVPDDSPHEWKDIDLGVNNNVAYFLSLQGVSLPSLKKLTEGAIQNKNYTSPYYPIPYSIIYFISRWYKGKGVNDIKDFLLKKQKNGVWENPLCTALALLSLHNLSAKISPVIMQKGIDYLIKTQKKDGGWKSYAFSIDPTIGGKNYYAGSSALTTAFCLEAIYKLKTKDEKQKNTKKSSKSDEEKMQKNIIKSARARFSMLGDDVKKQFDIALTRVRKMDKDNHITLLPYLFFKSLSSEEQNKIKGNKDELVANLCQANLYGWIAYTIYDDILDEEGDPKLLSVANVCLREVTHIYERVAVEYPEVAKTFHTTLDTIDSANGWEVSNCRDKSWLHIPDYGDLSPLANRSLGHALGPIALFLILGYKENSPEIQGLRTFFEHYLIARQLNDDAHDWEDDLKKGHINAVGAQVLTKASGRAFTHAREKGDFLLMEKLFWNTIIDAVCRNVTTHTLLAQKALKKFAHCTKESTLFTTILAGPEAMVAKTKKEKSDTLKFLKTF